MSTPVGTPKFMAPEIISAFNDHSSYSGSLVDCWAAGIVVYVMVAAAFPWTLATEMAMMESGEQQPPSLEYSQHVAGNWRMPAGFTPELTDFLRHACAIDPTQRWSCQQLLQHPWLSSLAIGEGDVSSPTMEQFFSEHDPDMQLDMQLEYRTLEFEDTAPTEQLEYLSAETVDESPRCKRRRHNRSGERIVVLEHAGRSTQQLAQDIVQAVETEFDGVQAEVEQQIVMISHTDPQRGFAQVRMVFESRPNEMSQITYQKNSGDQLAFHFLVNQINNLVLRQIST